MRPLSDCHQLRTHFSVIVVIRLQFYSLEIYADRDLAWCKRVRDWRHLQQLKLQAFEDWTSEIALVDANKTFWWITYILLQWKKSLHIGTVGKWTRKAGKRCYSRTLITNMCRFNRRRKWLWLLRAAHLTLRNPIHEEIRLQRLWRHQWRTWRFPQVLPKLKTTKRYSSLRCRHG